MTALRESIEFLRKLRRNDRLSEVEYQQISRIFLDTSPLALLLIVLFVLAGVVLWDHVPRPLLALFIIAFIADVIVKVCIVEYYKRRSEYQQQAGVWRRVIFFGVMFTSALWGASTLFLLVPMPVPNLVVGIGVFGVVIFIAITLARSYLPVQTIGACLSFLPMCIALLFSGTWQYQMLSLLLIWSLVILLMLFRNSAEVAVSRIRDQVRREERNRLVRELHDGMGMHLMSAIALSEQNENPLQLQSALRAALVEMRMLVNSVNGESRSLTHVLGSLREQIEPSIVNAGLKLEWNLDLPGESPVLSVAQQLHVTRTVQECVANVIKHAQATIVTIGSVVEDDSVDVLITDDGSHWQDATSTGAGVQNMEFRMRQLGGKFSLYRNDGATVARLSLPA